MIMVEEMWHQARDAKLQISEQKLAHNIKSDSKNIGASIRKKQNVQVNNTGIIMLHGFLCLNNEMGISVQCSRENISAMTNTRISI